MTVEQTASEAEVQVQVAPSEADEVQVAPSEAGIPVQEPTEADTATQETADPEAARRAEQAATDREKAVKDAHDRATAAERRAQEAEARARHIENTVLTQRQQDDMAAVQADRERQIEDLYENGDTEGARNLKRTFAEQDRLVDDTYNTAVTSGQNAAYSNVYNVERARAKEAGLSDEEITAAIATAGREKGYPNTVPFAIAADALVNARFERVGGDVPKLREQAKAQAAEIEALKTENAALKAGGEGGPPAGGVGGGSGGKLDAKTYKEKLDRGEQPTAAEVDAFTRSYLG